MTVETRDKTDVHESALIILILARFLWPGGSWKANATIIVYLFLPCREGSQQSQLLLL